MCQLEESLSAAINIHSDECCILDIHLDMHDGSPALQRLTGAKKKSIMKIILIILHQYIL
jgi:hypothetical protein